MTAQRIQLRSTKGWSKPEGAIVVARPGRWGNPFPISGDWAMCAAIALGYFADADGRRSASVALHRAWLTETATEMGPLCDEHVSGIAGFLLGRLPLAMPDRPTLDELSGRDLACWCPLDQPCHADLLLDLANGDGSHDTHIGGGKS